MAKSKAELMRATRKKRRDAGLVDFRAWVTPDVKAQLQATVDRAKAGSELTGCHT